MNEIFDRIVWQCKWFSELTPSELYKILQLRSRIFVVEQNCVYLDFDDKDQISLHLFAMDGPSLIAGTRIIPVGISYPECSSIGRVVVDMHYRNVGLGSVLMKKFIEVNQKYFGKKKIKIAAQYHLRQFYDRLGFRPVGDVFDEDGIPHITMEMSAPPA